MPNPLTYLHSPAVSNDELNTLFVHAWDGHQSTDFSYLAHSLLYLCAYTGSDLVGFVNVAWDGNKHAFLLDTTVHRDHQRKGIGKELVLRALEACRERNLEWVHVDYESDLTEFYLKCGFRPTAAGLVNLKA